MELKNLNTKYLARKFDYYKTIDSTQDEVWRRIEKRRNRKWRNSFFRTSNKFLWNSW